MSRYSQAKPFRIVRDLIASWGVDDYYLVILPPAGRDALLAACERLQWAATWIDEGGRRVPLDDGQKAIIDETIDALLQEESVNRIAEAIEYLADHLQPDQHTINVSGGDCGCNPLNYNPNETNPTSEQIDDVLSLPGGGIDTGGVPDGFSGRSEYEQHKCNVSHQLAVDFVQTISNMSSFGGMLAALGGILAAGLVNTTALSGLIVGLMAIGMSATGAVVLLLAVFLGMLAFGVGVFGYFAAVEAALVSRIPDLTCAFYLSTDSSDARARVKSIAGEVLTEVVFNDVEEQGFFSGKFYDLIDILLPSEVLEALWVAVDWLVEEMTEGENHDCSACQGESIDAEFQVGVTDFLGAGSNFVDGDDLMSDKIYIADSVVWDNPDPDAQRIRFSYQSRTSTTDKQVAEMIVLAITNYQPHSTSSQTGIRFLDKNDVLIVEHETTPATPFTVEGVHSFGLVGADGATVRVSFKLKGPAS